MDRQQLFNLIKDNVDLHNEIKTDLGIIPEISFLAINGNYSIMVRATLNGEFLSEIDFFEGIEYNGCIGIMISKFVDTVHNVYMKLRHSPERG